MLKKNSINKKRNIKTQNKNNKTLTKIKMENLAN